MNRQNCTNPWHSNYERGCPSCGTPLITVTEVSQEEFERISAECQAKAKRAARNKARRDRDQAMRDLGLVKVRGNLGGTYWE